MCKSMRWVKTVIEVVIVIAVIPMIVLAVTKTINQTKIERVVFTVLDDDGTITEGTIEKINKIGKDENSILTNLKAIYIDGVKLDNVQMQISYHNEMKSYIISFSENGSNTIDLGPLDKIVEIDYENSTIEIEDLINNNFVLEFEVNSLSPTIKTLITLIPLIFVSSVIFLIYKKQSNL